MITGPRRSRREERARRATLLAALLGLVMITGFLVISVTVQNGLPWDGGAELDLHFRTAGNLQRYDDVRIAGVRVGEVSSIGYERGFTDVRVRLDNGLAGMRSSTRAQIRLTGLIGAEYVELVPGDDGTLLHDGSVVPESHTITNPDLFDVLKAFDDPAHDRQRILDLRALIVGEGSGLLGNGERINQSLQTLPNLLSDSQQLLGTLRSESGAVRSFVPAAASFAAAIAPVAGRIAQSFGNSELALRPFARRSAEVAATLAQFPPTVQEAASVLPRVTPLLAATRRLANTTAALTAPAPAALRAATALLSAAGRPLADTAPVLRTVQPATIAAAALLNVTAPLIAPFGRSLTSTLPLLTVLDPRTCDIASGFTELRSLSSYGLPANNPMGANNFIRIIDDGSGATAEILSGSFPLAQDQYPAPCAASKEIAK